MTIPGTLSKTTISQLGCTDSISVRILLHSVSNNGSARIRCRNRQYIFEKSHETGCHILDIPMSLWMHNVNPGRYRAQGSICDDFRKLPGAEFTFHLVGSAPALEAAPAAPVDPGVMAEIRRLLAALGAPSEVDQAFEIAAENPAHLKGYVDAIIEAVQEQPDEPPVDDVPQDDAPDLSESNPAFPGSPGYTAEEAEDLEKMHWKAFEKKYGMRKADFIAAKETAQLV